MMPHDAPPRYRPNVAGILRNSKGEILIGERLHFPGSWQFPQGGVDDGEDYEAALVREMEEEIGLSPGDYAIRDSKGPYRYLYEPGRRKGAYDGQEQYYFLLDLLGPASGIRVETLHQEFRAVAWIAPAEFQLSWLPAFKLEVYKAVFRDFFSISL